MAVQFFQQLYQEDGNRHQLSTTQTFHQILGSDWDNLTRIPEQGEIHRAVMCMNPHKAPRPDGMQAIFL